MAVVLPELTAVRAGSGGPWEARVVSSQTLRADPAGLPTDNPFATPSDLPYELPPFDRIRPEHYRPAFSAGMAEQRAEVEAIATDPAEPGVVNTLDALERS